MCALTTMTTTLTNADARATTGTLCHDRAAGTLDLVSETAAPVRLSVNLADYGIQPLHHGHVFIPKWTDEPSHAEQLESQGLVRIERVLTLTDEVADDLPALTVRVHEVEVLV